MYFPHLISPRYTRDIYRFARQHNAPGYFPNFFSATADPTLQDFSRLEIEFMNDKLFEPKNRAKLSRHNSADKTLWPIKPDKIGRGNKQPRVFLLSTISSPIFHPFLTPPLQRSSKNSSKTYLNELISIVEYFDR